MKHIGVRMTLDDVARLDAVVLARGLGSRSSAVRALIRDASMAPEQRAAIPSRDELLHILGERARDGNTAAARFLLEELRRDVAPRRPPRGGVIDELAWRRRGGD